MTILSPGVPATPVAPTYTIATDVTPTSVTIHWTQLSNTLANNKNCSITGYYLEYAVLGTGSYSGLTPTTYIASSSFTQASGFEPGTNYTYRVSAVNAQGTGSSSPTLLVLTDAVP